ncbi:signal transduction histidine kinase/ligand-binding sensor domain-containing protein [Granulicella aggregans]|uniref:Signal transduction histidine kinase/ligand-binding sensor domain-containing protein n=2 Tax=Granulicella aggregans TaxID=474949 RepID=A0A7W7ZEC1_9BACT|nr:signal transduction histidine kinase/ligand-binding sensor domain-containing protein [Granulicella aggregans]
MKFRTALIRSRLIPSFEGIYGRGWLGILTLAALVSGNSAGMAQVASPAASSSAGDIRNLYHSTWTAREGTPVGIWRIAQSADGFLWIATNSGLYRFDGVQFTKFRSADGVNLLSENLVTLYGPHSGGLWVGYQFGGVSFIKDGKVTNYPAEGIFGSTPAGFLELKDGSLWTGTGQGMARFVDGHWQKMGPEWGFHGRSVFRPFLDASGTIWAYNGKTMQYLPAGEHRFHDTLIEGKLWGLWADRPDRTWLASENDLVELVRGQSGNWSLFPTHANFSPGLAAEAPDGSFWMGSDQSGVFRLPTSLPSPGVPIDRRLFQNFAAKDGLTADLSIQVIRDREGSMWVATEKGLDQFRPAALSSIAMPTATNGIALAQDKDGLLIGVKNIHGPSLFRLKDDALVPIPNSPEGITSLYADAASGVWIGVTGQLWHLVDGRFVKIPMPEDGSGLPLEIQSMTTDAKHILWASILGHGTFELIDGQWIKFKAPDQDHFAVLSMFCDHEGRIWQGFIRNKIAVVAGNTTNTLGPNDGVTAGNILAIVEHGDHVWLGGTEGLSYYRNGKVHSILSSGENSIQGVNGIVENADGSLWLNQSTGVISIPADELARSFSDPHHRVSLRFYNYLDGLTSAPVQLRPLPSALGTNDGRIFFAGRHQLTWINPAKIARNGIAPAVFVDEVVADGREYLSPSSVRLDRGAENLRFDYTAPSLLIPQRVRFRYKLEGFDKAWQDAGTRRQAFYAKIPPGHYTFRVMASNNDEVWSPAGAAIAFYLPPTFLQSWYFTALVVLLTAGALSLLYKLRLRHATNQVRARLVERLRERERIAQDLHDTFFQSIQVLLLRFSTITKQLPQGEPARRSYENALKHSEQVITEGRELLVELRSEPVESTPLPLLLKEMIEDLRPATEARLTIAVAGSSRNLNSAASAEARKIAQEALANAIRHAGASRIDVLLEFNESDLRLVVRDNGCGIPSKVLSSGYRDGHLGMPGMRERARQIGARLEAGPGAVNGTIVELHVPATTIYATDSFPDKQTSTLSFWTLLKF